MTRAPYPTDLTDRQWRRLEPLLPPAQPGGRPRSADPREVMNAILDVLRNGVVWRALPHDFPPWKTAHHSFGAWRQDGTWEAIHDALRAEVRLSNGREPTPSAAIVDSRSVKTTGKGGPRGCAAAKCVKGRKRHIRESAGAKLVRRRALGRFPRLRLIGADRGSKDHCVAWAKAATGWVVEVVAKPQAQRGFAVPPRRWVVERTFAWIGRSRRLSKDYEGLPETHEAWVQIAMIHLMLRRLAPP
jgi:putative transposase